MNKLEIKGTNTTPQVNFDAETGKLEMQGTIIQEDTAGFFKPIFEWLDSFKPDKQTPILMRLCFYYYNTSASKRIFVMLKKLDELFQNGYNVKVVWEHEEGDEDSIQECQGYKRFLKLPVDIRPI